MQVGKCNSGNINRNIQIGKYESEKSRETTNRETQVELLQIGKTFRDMQFGKI